jgi:hypothetical protein
VERLADDVHQARAVLRERFLERSGELAGIGDAPAPDAEGGGDLGVIRRFEIDPELCPS